MTKNRVMRGFPYRYENVMFFIDWDVWYEFVNEYRDAVLAFAKENKSKMKIDYVHVIYFEDLTKFLFELFEDVLPLDLEVEIRKGFFERYFNNFRIEIKANHHDDITELVPDFKFDNVYVGRFEVNERFV